LLPLIEDRQYLFGAIVREEVEELNRYWKKFKINIIKTSRLCFKQYSLYTRPEIDIYTTSQMLPLNEDPQYLVGGIIWKEIE
jgi:hypothetical protein